MFESIFATLIESFVLKFDRMPNDTELYALRVAARHTTEYKRKNMVTESLVKFQHEVDAMFTK